MNKKVVAVLLIIALIAGALVLYLVKPDFLKGDVVGKKIKTEKLKDEGGVLKKGKKGKKGKKAIILKDEAGADVGKKAKKGIILKDEAGVEVGKKAKKKTTPDSEGKEIVPEATEQDVPSI